MARGRGTLEDSIYDINRSKKKLGGLLTFVSLIAFSEKVLDQLGTALHYPSIQETEAGEWKTTGQPGLHSKTLSPKKENK
jgi:hypothetical protein